jgi:hypothetical protein
VDKYLLKPVPLERLVSAAAELIARQDEEDEAAEAAEAEAEKKGKKK